MMQGNRGWRGATTAGLSGFPVHELDTEVNHACKEQEKKEEAAS